MHLACCDAAKANPSQPTAAARTAADVGPGILAAIPMIRPVLIGFILVHRRLFVVIEGVARQSSLGEAILASKWKCSDHALSIQYHPHPFGCRIAGSLPISAADVTDRLLESGFIDFSPVFFSDPNTRIFLAPHPVSLIDTTEDLIQRPMKNSMPSRPPRLILQVFFNMP
jgi:hypothetical protein